MGPREKGKEKRMETNTAQAGDARRDALFEAQKKADERHRRMKEVAGTHLRETMTRWLDRLGIADALTVGSVVVDFAVKLEFAPDSRGYRNGIEAYFRPGWQSECMAECGKRRFLEVSINSVRLAAGRSHDVLVAKIAGRLAEHIAEIEADLLDFGWDAYDAAERELYAARDALSQYDAKCAAAECERKAQEVRARLVAGVRVDTCERSALRRPDDVRTIERVSTKCLFFKNGDKRRVPLADALKKIVNGVWRIVE